MLELNQRWIHYYGLTLQSAPLDSPPFNIDDCFLMLKRKFSEGKAYRLNTKQTSCIRISDMLLNKSKRRVSILFQYSDSKISDPAFSNLESGELRSEPKLAGEGVAVSAHAIINLDPIKENGLEFLMLLEDVPGIGKSKIVPFLNFFFKEIMTREVITPEGNKIQSHPVVGMDQFASQTLQDDLEEGVLKFVELVKNQTILELDEEPLLDKVVQAVQVRAVKATSGQPAVDFINRVKEIGQEKGYHDMRVVFKKPEGKQRSVRMATFREDAGDALFGKMEIVSTDYDLAQCAAKIDKKFLAKMRALHNEA